VKKQRVQPDRRRREQREADFKVQSALAGSIANDRWWTMVRDRSTKVDIPPDRLFEGLDARELVIAETLVLSAYQARVARPPGLRPV
jgi:hypothetical protein